MSSSGDRQEAAPPLPAATETVPQGSSIVEAKDASLTPVTTPPANFSQTTTSSDGMTVALKTDPGPQTTESTAERKAVKHQQAPTGTAPEVALRWLRNGNIRFVKGTLRKDGQSKKDIARVARKQKPHSVVLSCSDSRVPPEVVFDQKLGEIFTIRTAGEALSAPVIGSIEYAIERLGTRLILVMGHTQCGAVRAAAATLNGGSAGSSHLDEMVADIQPRIKGTLYGKRAPSSHFETESWANARGVATALAERSEIIARAVEDGRVKIVSSLYHLEHGKVEFDGL